MKPGMYDPGNQAAAKIILADVERYGGEESLLVMWARATMARFEAQNGRSAIAEPDAVVGEGQREFKPLEPK